MATMQWSAERCVSVPAPFSSPINPLMIGNSRCAHAQICALTLKSVRARTVACRPQRNGHAGKMKWPNEPNETPSSFHNRIAAVMMHVPYYSFRGIVRLAADAGVAHSTVVRIIAGKTNPTFAVMVAITAALERRLGDESTRVSW